MKGRSWNCHHQLRNGSIELNGSGSKVVAEHDGQQTRMKVPLTRPQMSNLLSNELHCDATANETYGSVKWSFHLGAATRLMGAAHPSGICLLGAKCVSSAQRGGGVTLPLFLAGGFTPEEEVAADHYLCRRAPLNPPHPPPVYSGPGLQVAKK